MTFGQRLKAARVLRGWSQAELAAVSGVERTVINRYESKGGSPRNVGLIALVKALWVESLWLLGDDRPFYTVYRPVSPYVKKTAPVTEKAQADIKEVLPGLLESMKTPECRWYVCPLGRILVATGEGRGVMVICTPKLADTFNMVYPEIPIKVELFVNLLLNPLEGLRQPDLDPVFVEFADNIYPGWNMYAPPSTETKICFKVKEQPTKEQIEAVLQASFPGGIFDIQVEPPAEFRDSIPAEIKTWISEQGLNIDEEGKLVK